MWSGSSIQAITSYTSGVGLVMGSTLSISVIARLRTKNATVNIRSSGNAYMCISGYKDGVETQKTSTGGSTSSTLSLQLTDCDYVIICGTYSALSYTVTITDL